MYYTLFLYNFVLFSSTFLVYLSEKASTRLQRKVCMVLAFLIVFIPAALRYEIGIDYFSYEIMFNNVKDGTSTFFESRIEPGYYFLNWIVVKSGLSFEYLIATVSFFISLFFFKSYPNKNKTVFHFVLWITIYLETFNTLRSMLAAGLLMLAVSIYIKNKNNLKYFVLVFIAASFHKSAFLFLLLPLISERGFFTYCLKYKLVLPLIVLLVYFFGGKLTGFIMDSWLTQFFGFSGYADSWYNREVEFNSGLGVVAVILFFIYVIASFSKRQENREILYLVVSLTAISIVLSSYVAIFERLKLLFVIGFPIAAWLLFSVKKDLLSRVAILGIILIGLLNFNKSIYFGSTDYMDTCRSARITPYISVFNKEDSVRDPVLTRFAVWCDDYFDKLEK